MESEFSIEAATQFSAVAEVVADIVQRGVEAFQRLAEAIGRILEPMLEFGRCRFRCRTHATRCARGRAGGCCG